jgi:phosphoesterase RecJ-like protein
VYENNIFDAVKAVNKVVIAGHTSPDGDAVGSTFAFAQALAQKGLKPVILLEDYAERFDFIKGSEYVFKGDYDSLKPDIFFSLDCGDKERLGRAAAVFHRAAVTYNIDHHISNEGFADYNIVNARASSASEIVYELIKDNCEITGDIATAIYSGIVFDTSGFKHNSTSQRTHIVAGELVGLGVDTAFIHAKILYEHSVSQLKVMSCALCNAHIDTELGIAYSVITKEELEGCGAVNGDTDGVAEYLLNIRGVNVSALLTQRDLKKVKISLRSKKYNVNKVAATFGGGGHILAAGASSNMSLDDTLTALIDRIKEEIINEKQ